MHIIKLKFLQSTCFNNLVANIIYYRLEEVVDFFFACHFYSYFIPRLLELRVLKTLAWRSVEEILQVVYFLSYLNYVVSFLNPEVRFYLLTKVLRHNKPIYLLEHRRLIQFNFRCRFIFWLQLSNSLTIKHRLSIDFSFRILRVKKSGRSHLSE